MVEELKKNEDLREYDQLCYKWLLIAPIQPVITACCLLGTYLEFRFLSPLEHGSPHSV